MSVIAEESWERAFKTVKEQFEILIIFYLNMENSLWEFLCEFADRLRQIFHFPVPSDCGRRSVQKASCFQCYRCDIAVAIAYGRQVQHLNDMGVPAITITDEENLELIQQVLNGNCVLVYGSPECLLSTESWRSIFDCESFKKMLIGVAIDVAHCITQWYVSSYNVVKITAG